MSVYIQGSEAWHKLRKSKITATDAPVIMGVNPWTTPYQRWQEKTCESISDRKTEAMQRGIDLEPIARDLFSLKTGIELIPKDDPKNVIISNKNEWMMASLDGIDVTNSHIVEIKCP